MVVVAGLAGWPGSWGVDRDAPRARWEAFEPVLESGGALGDTQGQGPELSRVAAVAAEFGVGLDAADWALIEADPTLVVPAHYTGWKP